MADAETVVETDVDTTTKPDGESVKPKTYSEDYVKRLIAERDNVKGRLRGFEEEKKKIEESEAVKRGEFEKVLSEKDKQIAELLGLKDEVEKYRVADAARREALLEKLPEGKRELYASVPTEALADVIETLLAAKGEPTKPAKPGAPGEKKRWEDFSGVEQIALKAENPPLYRTLYVDFYKRKNGKEPQFIP